MRTTPGREATEKAYTHLGRTLRTGMEDEMLFVEITFSGL